MSSFHNNHGPMISGGCGSQFQLIITNPTGPAGSSLAKTARYHGLACGQSAAAASESSTELTNRSCPGATRSARTASRFWSVISSRVTATAVRLQATVAGSRPPGFKERAASRSNDLGCDHGADDHGHDLRVWVELRGFDPLIP